MKIDLMEDYWVKNILGNEEYTRPLEVISENVLRLPKGFLEKQIEIKSHEYPFKKATYKEKNIRADVFAFLGNNVILNLEAYKTFNEENLRKSNVYLCRGYSSQLKKSMPYHKMKKFIQINLVDHVKKGVLQDKLMQRYFLEEQGYPLTDDIQIYYIRLYLLDKLNYNVGINDKVMNEERSMFKKARDYGCEEGIDIGMSKGIDIVARNLLKETNDINYISKVTGLTEKEIEKLKQAA